MSEDANEEQKSALEDSFLNFAKFCIAEPSCAGYACGWVLERLPHPEVPTGKAITFNTIFGRPAKEEYEKLKGNPKFVEMMNPIIGVALSIGENDSFLVRLHVS